MANNNKFVDDKFFGIIKCLLLIKNEFIVFSRTVGLSLATGFQLLTAEVQLHGKVNDQKFTHSERFDDHTKRQAFIGSEYSFLGDRFPTTSFDIHYAFSLEEAGSAAALQMKLVAWLEEKGETDFKIDVTYFNTKPAGPWTTPSFGLDLVLVGNKAEFHAALHDLVDWLKMQYELGGHAGSLIIHPNSTPKDSDYVEERRDHFERAWLVAGPVYQMKDIWGAPGGLIELGEFVKANRGVLTDEQIRDQLRGKGVSERQITLLMSFCFS